MLCLIFAFFVLLITTGNIVVALYSVITIAIILASVCALVFMIGWELGVAVSLGLDLFVGFSVDHVVHVSH